jgi:hypothetical protein
MIRQQRRWQTLRKLVVVADSTYAVLELLACAAKMIEPVTIVTRLRLDAALYEPAPMRKPGTTGRPRKKGARQRGVVWRDHTHGRTGERNRCLVAQRIATGGNPVGAHAGSAGTV